MYFDRLFRVKDKNKYLNILLGLPKLTYKSFIRPNYSHLCWKTLQEVDLAGNDFELHN